MHSNIYYNEIGTLPCQSHKCNHSRWKQKQNCTGFAVQHNDGSHDTQHHRKMECILWDSKGSHTYIAKHKHQQPLLFRSMLKCEKTYSLYQKLTQNLSIWDYLYLELLGTSLHVSDFHKNPQSRRCSMLPNLTLSIILQNYSMLLRGSMLI